jgi:Skp family chaperone for outer membrane proteins
MLVKPQLLLLAASFAGIAAAQGPIKIGIINIQAAIANTEDGKKALQALETKFAPKRKEIE